MFQRRTTSTNHPTSIFQLFGVYCRLRGLRGRLINCTCGIHLLWPIMGRFWRRKLCSPTRLDTYQEHPKPRIGDQPKRIPKSCGHVSLSCSRRFAAQNSKFAACCITLSPPTDLVHARSLQNKSSSADSSCSSKNRFEIQGV